MNVFLWLTPYITISIFIGIISGCVGTHVYTRRISGVAGGLAHFLIAPIVVVYAVQTLFDITIPSIVFSIVCVIVLAFLLPIDDTGKFKAFQEVQVLWGFGMSLGFFILFLLPTRFNLETFFLGSLLTINTFGSVITIMCATMVFFLHIIFELQFKYLGIDDTFLKLCNINTRVFHRLQMCIIYVSIAVLLESVGILMLVGIITIPVAIVSLFAKSYRALWVYSIISSVVVLIIGIYASYIFNVQFTSFVVLLVSCVYFLLKLINKIVLKKGKSIF